MRLGVLPDLRRKFWAVRDRLTTAPWLGGALDTPEKSQAVCTANAEAEWILKCIKNFSADEWKEGCTYDEKFDCGCGNDDGMNYCCGSANQTEAIEIWSQCLAGE